ncbi:MAG: prepilin-type N-terminal cleavage/methylation domain-containing protein [Verrucomicrobiia bacterium]
MKGFTLVEIMIVVAIIALLAALAIPGFLRARVRAQASAVLNDARVLDGIVSQYMLEQNLITVPAGAVSAFSDELTPYVKDNSKLIENNFQDRFSNDFDVTSDGTLTISSSTIDDLTATGAVDEAFFDGYR